jgi:uncharacterized protein YlxP (DUF503 family)
MVVGVCRVSLMIEESQSLKDRRSVLRRIKDRVSQKYNCAIAEVGDPDSWQAAQLGFSVVSNDRGFTQSMVQKILQFIEDLALAKVISDEQDFIDYGEGALEGASRGDYPHWEPDEPSPVSGRSAFPKPPKIAAVDYPWNSPEAPEADIGEPAGRAPGRPGLSAARPATLVDQRDGGERK